MRLPRRELRFLDDRVRLLTGGGGDPGYRDVVADSPASRTREATWRNEYPDARRVVCQATHHVLHHRTYERFGGDERNSELVPLCRDHHEEVHAWVERNLDREDALWVAHEVVRKSHSVEQARRADVAARLRQRRLLRDLVMAKRRLDGDPMDERLAERVERLDAEWRSLEKVAMGRGSGSPTAT